MENTYITKMKNWKIAKRNQCPLCEANLKISSMRSHIFNFMCEALIELEEPERSQVHRYFRTKILNRPRIIPHQPTIQEELAKKIHKLVDGAYYKRKLYLLCLLSQESCSSEPRYEWIPGSLLQMSLAGRRLMKREYRTGFLK